MGSNIRSIIEGIKDGRMETEPSITDRFLNELERIFEQQGEKENIVSWFAQIIAGFKIKHRFFLGIVQMSALTALRDRPAGVRVPRDAQPPEGSCSCTPR